MATNRSQVMQESVSFFLTEDDFLNLSETTDNFHKTLEAVHEVILYRNSIFTQKKEKHQQILDREMMKLDNERKEYIMKSESVMKEMSDAKSKLMQIEHYYFNLRNNLNLEREANHVLKEEIKHLQLEKKQKSVKFYETAELFRAVIDKYQRHLNITVTLDEENWKVFRVTFTESKKDFNGHPYANLELVEDNNFQILKLHPPMKDGSNSKQILLSHEITPFLNKFRKEFLDSTEGDNIMKLSISGYQ